MPKIECAVLTDLVRILSVSVTFYQEGTRLMQKLSSPKIQIIHRGGQSILKPLVPKKEPSFFGFLSSSRAAAQEKPAPAVFKEPFLKNSRSHVPRANLAAIENWVGLEERIVHDYTERKAASSKAAILPRIPGIFEKSSQPVSVIATSKKESALSHFIASLRAKSRGKTKAFAPKEPLRKKDYSHAPQAGLAEVKNWVALEEKIIRDHVEEKTVSPGRGVSLSKATSNEAPLVFEAFNTQTTASSPRILRTREPVQGAKTKKPFKFSWGALFFAGWLLAGVLVFLLAQEVSRSREASSQLEQVRSTKDWLDRSYSDLKKASVEKSAEIQWLNSQLRDLASELKTALEQRDAYKLDITRITARFESQLNALRGDIQTRDATVSGLKAQIRTFEGIMDHGGMASVPGAASQVFRASPETASSLMSGRVSAVNARQGFFVVDVGYEHGINSGDGVMVSRDGVGLTVGRVDRVYPTMSTVIVPDKRVLNNIFKGDTVSFA